MTAEQQRQTWREQKRRQRVRKGLALAPLGEKGELPARPTREWLLRALGVQARKGNVMACRLLLEEYRRDGESDKKRSTSAIDELARRRNA
jgi:hypothetical protein